GRVTVEARSRHAAWVRFAAKCTGTPCAELRHADTLVLGLEAVALQRSLPSHESERWLDEQSIISELISDSALYLSMADARLIATRLASYWRQKLAVIERVRLSMCKI